MREDYPIRLSAQVVAEENIPGLLHTLGDRLLRRPGYKLYDLAANGYAGDIGSRRIVFY